MPTKTTTAELKTSHRVRPEIRLIEPQNGKSANGDSCGGFPKNIVRQKRLPSNVTVVKHWVSTGRESTDCAFDFVSRARPPSLCWRSSDYGVAATKGVTD